MIVFVGNVLSRRGRAISYTEFLVDQLRKSTTVELQLISNYRNKLLRLSHAVFFLLFHRKKIQLVVIDTFSTSAFYYAYVVARLCQWLGIQYILVLHGGNLPVRYQRSPAPVNRIFRGAFCIVSPSFYLARFFQQAGFSIQVIPNALALQHYPFKSRTSISPQILWVRAFDAIYNPVLALQALQLLLPKFPTAHLTMVGPVKDASYQACVDYAAQHELQNAVTFTGLLSREQWIAESSKYDIFLNTTTIDNQPVSLLEAMALGFLVISTNVGGIPFLVEHGVNGLLVPSSDAPAMAAALDELLTMSDEKRAGLSAGARNFAAQFDWKNIESKWLTLLRQAL